MTFNYITQNALTFAWLSSLVFGLFMFLQSRLGRSHLSFSLALLIQTLWLLLWLNNEKWLETGLSMQLAEGTRYLLWIYAMIQGATLLRAKALSSSAIRTIAFLALTVFVVPVALEIMDMIHVEDLMFSVSIMVIPMAIIGIFCACTLIMSVGAFRFARLVYISAILMFLFDLALFGFQQHYHLSEDTIWQMRSTVVSFVNISLIFGMIILRNQFPDTTRFVVHKRKTFYTSVFVFIALSVGISLSVGLYLRPYLGAWGIPVKTAMMCITIMFFGLLLTSSSLREGLNAFILKNIFKLKYDYRSEWVRLINQLSTPVKSEDVYRRALEAVIDLFSCDGGILWVKRSRIYTPVAQIGTNIDIAETIELETSYFTTVMRDEEWVYAPRAHNHKLEEHNNLLPPWVDTLPDAWLIMPLITERSLNGYILLTSRNPSDNLNWEDLDLIKTVGRQVGNYLKRHEQSELLAESRQFETFNKLSAYVMHDLKNLIAQQSLVVKNAEKHKDNPAFVEDAINTINNSVVRMNNLLKKLQQSNTEEVKVFAIKDALIEAVKRSHKTQPIPSILAIDPEWRVKADFDNLVMVFTHLIQNAQDATPNDGYIDISAEKNGKLLDVVIEDNGSGMDHDFVQNRLFKPFETTKSGRGMGIGVYQAKDYVESLGGTIEVESTLGEGSTFTVTIPCISHTP